MKIPMSWLKSLLVDLDLPPVRQFMEDMTMIGIGAESYISLGADISNVVVGRITAIEKHPNADKLLITKVDTGSSEVQIVTGAKNLQVGDYVPVALEGATLHGGFKIKKGKLRGEVSQGMLCSIEELGYTRQDYPEAPEDGIYIFGSDCTDFCIPLGSDVRPVLELVDDVVEFELFSNRPDCQSVIGIAREVCAAYGKTLPPPSQESGGGQVSDHISDYIGVEIRDPDLCPRYTARIVKNVRIGPSPLWLRHRLTASGIRPINNIVDITNYVMLEYGQPLHAFDIDEIAEQKIIVRRAQAGEEFTTLDGTPRRLDETMLVIADPQKAVAIAGIMGGENSMVTGKAAAVLFESANFDGSSVRLTAKKLGMRTDASAKFEKGIDPNLTLLAVNRAIELITLLSCGEVVPGVADSYPGSRKPYIVSYCPQNIRRHLGIEAFTGSNVAGLTDSDIEEILARIGIEASGGKAKIPTFRPDITCEADISEEVARFYGYNNIPTNLQQRNITCGGKTFYQRGEEKVKNTMVALGYSEALTSPLEGAKILDKLNISADSPSRKGITILNPIGEDCSLLRTTPLNGILESLSLNYNRRNGYARLFELTKVFLPNGEGDDTGSGYDTGPRDDAGSGDGTFPPPFLPKEEIYLTIGAYNTENPMDFFDIKGDLEEFFDVLGVKCSFSSDITMPYLHPGRAGAIFLDYDDDSIDYANSECKSLGHIGELHPDTANSYKIGTRVYIAVIALKPLIDAIKTIVSYVPLPKYPSSTRDIALQVKEDIPASVVEKALWEKAGPLLTKTMLFDVYHGEQVEEGYKSMAYTLTFRSSDRTLLEEEVSAPMDKILRHLNESLGIRLREK